MHALAEPRLRALVADTLGVGVEELSPNVSLVDDLAADSLDLAELVVRLESECGVELPDGVVEEMRTYGDLVVATRSARPAAADTPLPLALPIWARLVSPGGELVVAELLTPYAAETIAGHALAAGRDTRLDLTVPGNVPDAQLERVRAAFAWLREHGIRLRVGRHRELDRSEAA